MVGDMQQSSNKPKRASARQVEMKWLAENRAYLEKTFPGKWLALDGARIVGVGDSLSEAREQALTNGVPQPFFTAMRTPEYQNIMLFRAWR